MKTLLAFMPLVLLLSVSCKEEEKTGVCMACCDANGDKICKGKFTEKMCADYNKNHVDGFDWTFSEGFPYCVRPPN